MKKIKDLLLKRGVVIGAFVLAAVLLSYAGIGTARGALTVLSQTLTERMETTDLGVTIIENGTDVSGDALLSSIGEKDADGNLTQIALGKTYENTLAARNTESTNEYVRVTIRKYWVDENGDRVTDLSPDMISLKLGDLDLYDDDVTQYGAWQKDADATTTERVVLYYGSLLAGGSDTAAFADNITISPELAAEVSQAPDPKNSSKIITTYKYNGVSCCIEAHVDAVQENNAQDAIISSWGVNASISADEEAHTGTLTLQ